MSDNELLELLEELYSRYDKPEFIENDPISIPHKFVKEEDIEISGFLSATIAWGKRNIIVRNAERMVSLMEGEPYRFVMEASDREFISLFDFVHRTFNGEDFITFVKSLKNIYRNHGGLKTIFVDSYKSSGDIRFSLEHFREIFFEEEHLRRSERHLSSITKKSACKRLNMFLRWLVRSDENGVDFGIWSEIPSSALYIPLDVHVGNVSRELGLLGRKQNDWRAVEELTQNLRRFDSNDPVKYDYALFGVGINNDL